MSALRKYRLEVQRYGATYPWQRAGQVAFNVLYNLHPELANEIRGTKLDPFHRNERLQAFNDWVAQRLSEEAA